MSERLAPGHHLFQADDGGWRCLGPDDAVIKVHGPDATLVRAQRLLHGATSTAPTDDDALTRLLALFAEHGLLVDEADGAPKDARRTLAVLVEGDDRVADAVCALLGADVTLERGRFERVSDGAPDVVVSCAGWLPDARWRALDLACRDAGIACHTCHAEGTRYFVGPFAVPGDASSYTDLRARRLAASPFPDELRACWHYLDDPDAVQPAVRRPAAPAAASIAALIANDVLAYAAGRVPPGVGHEVEVDPGTLAIVRHPVLPLPRAGLLAEVTGAAA